MYKSTIAYSYQEQKWVLPEWDYFVDELSNVFRFTAEEKISFIITILQK